jgi:hypothetical protein
MTAPTSGNQRESGYARISQKEMTRRVSPVRAFMENVVSKDRTRRTSVEDGLETQELSLRRARGGTQMGAVSPLKRLGQAPEQRYSSGFRTGKRTCDSQDVAPAAVPLPLKGTPNGSPDLSVMPWDDLSV